MSHCLSSILERRFNRVGRPHVADVWDGDGIVRRGRSPDLRSTRAHIIFVGAA